MRCVSFFLRSWTEEPSEMFVISPKCPAMYSGSSRYNKIFHHSHVKGRLKPGKMFLVDFDRGEVVPDAKVTAQEVIRTLEQSIIDSQQP